MTQPLEITIQVKGNEKSLTHKHLIYEEHFDLSCENEVLNGFVKKAVDDFKEQPEVVKIKALLVV